MHMHTSARLNIQLSIAFPIAVLRLDVDACFFRRSPKEFESKPPSTPGHLATAEISD
jgi:hypothetical protein